MNANNVSEQHSINVKNHHHYCVLIERIENSDKINLVYRKCRKHKHSINSNIVVFFGK